MRKLLLIGLKDLTLIFMLLAPFLLTVGLGFVTGRFSGNTSGGLRDIPVVIVNLDDAELGNALVDVFRSKDLTDLVEPTEADNPDAARRLVGDDQTAAALIIPDGFTESIIPTQGMITAMQAGQAAPAGPVQIEVYANPARPTSAGVIKAIVDEFISRIEEGRITGITGIFSIPGLTSLPADQIENLVRGMFESAEDEDFTSAAITLKTDNEGAAANDFDPLAYMAPGMALMFLMFTVSYGGRSILAERSQGTLRRLLTTPTRRATYLLGTISGQVVMAIVQTAMHALPTTWAMQGMLDLVLRGRGLVDVLPEAGVLLVFAAVFFGIGVWRFRYE